MGRKSFGWVYGGCVALLVSACTSDGSGGATATDGGATGGSGQGAAGAGGGAGSGGVASGGSGGAATGGTGGVADGGAGGTAGAGGSATGGTSSGGSAGGPDGGPCVPACGGRACGDDGCGSSCGDCGDGLTCGATGTCVASSCAAGCKTGCPQGCFDLGDCAATGGGTLDLEPNVFTAGVVLTLAAAPTEAELYYRPAGSATWWRGPALTRIPDGRLAGSAFHLAADSGYDVRVVAGAAVACGTLTTEPETPPSAVTRDVWVDAAAAPGGDGSSASPFRTLQAGIDAAGPGVDVHVRAGVYREEVSVSKSGSPGAYLRILGESGAVLDGSDPGATSPSWTDDGGGTWSTPWPGDPRYVSRDGARLYHYASLADLTSGTGTGVTPLPVAEGFVVEGGRLHVRVADAPAGHTWQIPVLNTAIQVAGRTSVWIEGLEIRFYGDGDYAKGIDVTEAATDIVIRKNHVHDVPTAIWTRKGASQVRIEENDVHQSSVFGWAWESVKATDHENDAIQLGGGRGSIVARNTLHDVFNGVYTGSFSDDQNPALAFDVDVYENRLARIGDDGLEPEGACVNHRFWGNAVDVVHNGVSLAPITFGPVWVVRNRFTDYDESGFKVSNDTSGRVWLYHNTCFTDRPGQNGMNVSGPFENLVFRNNVIRGTSYSIESTVVVATNDLDYDALFTTRGPPRVKWNDVRYDDLASLCAATTLECHGVGADPALTAPGSGAFAPAPGSPLIDAAQRLYGINDAFSGAAPDIGYVEAGAAELPGL